MSRNVFDLSHFIFSAFHIGRLQTLSVVPNLAGDSFDIDFNGLFRLASLRRQLSLDAVVDLFAFYIPHRHHYPGHWLEFIKQGMLGGVTLPPAPDIPDNINCLAQQNVSGVMPLWRVQGYDQIYNRYFRHPNDAERFLLQVNDDATRKFGLTCCHLKRMWNTGLNDFKDLHDSEHVPISGGTSPTFDIWDLEKTKSIYNNVATRKWFSVRYNDIMKRTWGAGVNVDADMRPTLLGRSTTFLSGYDVDGTSKDSLGLYNGKAYKDCKLRIPRTFLPEHGAVWLMGLVRFPCVHEQERHYLAKIPSPSYIDMTADPRVVPAMAPQMMRGVDYFHNGTLDDFGLQPYACWYREQPHVVHFDYDDQNGYPFLTKIPDNARTVAYIHHDDYAGVFQAPDQIGHASCQSKFSLEVHRVLPSAVSGIFVK